MKKTTKAEFNRFKKAFVYWQERLGLTQYRIDFFHEKLRQNDGTTYYAQAQIFEKDKFVKVSLTTEVQDKSVDEGPEAHARHEVFHLLIHRLTWLGESRFLDEYEIEDEAEAIVVRLEKVLK